MARQVIVILEDDVVLRQRFEIVLENEGYKTIGADDSANIIELLDRYSPDLLITDLFMPGHNGAEAIIQIRKLSNIPIIVVTGYENMLKVVKHMVNASLLKPVSDAQLLNVVKEVMKESLIS